MKVKNHLHIRVGYGSSQGLGQVSARFTVHVCSLQQSLLGVRANCRKAWVPVKPRY